MFSGLEAVDLPMAFTINLARQNLQCSVGKERKETEMTHFFSDQYLKNECTLEIIKICDVD